LRAEGWEKVRETKKRPQVCERERLERASESVEGKKKSEIKRERERRLAFSLAVRLPFFRVFPFWDLFEEKLRSRVLHAFSLSSFSRNY